MSPTNKFDDLLARLGTGWWNVVFFLSVGYWNMHLPPNTLAGPFIAPAVAHTCLPPDHGYTLTSTTFSHTTGNITTANNCVYYTNDTEGGGFRQKDCDTWDYDNTTYVLTLTSQFDLVCSSEYLRATYQSIYMFGTFIGAPINGLTSDRYGRKMTLTLGVLMYYSLGLASSWLTSFAAILAFRFILGFIHPAVLQTGYILALEVCEPRYRAILGILLSLPWAFGTMAWGGAAYLIRDWRWLQLAVNLTSLLIFPALWFLDESPRWQIVHGKIDQATKTLEKAARLNHSSLPPREDLHTLMHTILQESYKVKQLAKEKQVETRTCRHKFKQFLLRLLILYRIPKLRFITCILCFKFFFVSLIFYGMSLNAVNYSANPFLYMVLSGLVELPAYLITAPIVARFGRKWPIIILYFITGVVIITVAFVPVERKVVVMGLALGGHMCISAAFQVLYLYCMELFPTEVRLQGLGYCTIFSRIGSMISPFITELLGPLYPSAPSLVFGVGALLAGLATLPLMETLGKKLPDTITDLDTSPSDLIRMEKCGAEQKEEDVIEEEEEAEAAEDVEAELAMLRA